MTQNEQKQLKMRQANPAHLKKRKRAKSRYKMTQKQHKAIQKSQSKQKGELKPERRI